MRLERDIDPPNRDWNFSYHFRERQSKSTNHRVEHRSSDVSQTPEFTLLN